MWGISCACDKNFLGNIIFMIYFDILGLIKLLDSPLILGKILNALFEAINIFDVWLWYQSFSK